MQIASALKPFLRSLCYPSLAAILSLLAGCDGLQPTPREPVKRVGTVPNVVILGITDETSELNAATLNQKLCQLAPQLAIQHVELIFQTPNPTGTEYVVAVELAVDQSSSSQLAGLSQQLAALTTVSFASPLYRYEGDLTENSTADDSANPMRGKQTHLDLIEADAAWQLMDRFEGPIVAVTDDGFDFAHEDLRGQFWQNPAEVGTDKDGEARASNDRDDDRNGYRDDYRGWDFTEAGDNDPSPENNLLFGLDAHGTHIAGIIAAKADNGIGVQGIAPNARIMALRFSGSGNWNALNVARAYAYAVRHGAKIISTSYAIDQFIDDPVYRAALRHAYRHHTLLFNSAGNNGQRNPARQAFNEVLLVANTQIDHPTADQKNPNSNYGSGIDLSAPGKILSTVPQNGYRVQVGTSMATPVAASVAALIWQQHPDWTRDQVATQLLGTTDPINQKNPSFQGLLGSGRVNARRALTDSPRPPRLILAERQLLTDQSTLTVKLDGVIDGQTYAQLDAKFIDAAGRAQSLRPISDYRIGSNQLSWQLPQQLAPGPYQLVIPATLTDPFGQALDGNHDGEPGDAFRRPVELMTPDHSAPTLQSIQISSVDVNAGERLAIQVAAKDDRAGPIDVAMTFRKADGAVDLSVRGVQSSPPDLTTIELPIPATQDNGVYTLAELILTDQQGNRRQLTGDDLINHPAWQATEFPGFTVSGGVNRDRLGPVVQDIVVPEVVEMGQPVSVRVRAYDGQSSVARIELYWRSRETYETVRTEATFAPRTDPEPPYELTQTMPQLEKRQHFYLAGLTLTDTQGNRRRYQATATAKSYPGTQLAVPSLYLVERRNSDLEAPALIDMRLITQRVAAGGVAEVDIEAADNAHAINRIQAFFKLKYTVVSSNLEFTQQGPDRYRLEVPFTNNDDPGVYRLYKVILEDELGNRQVYQSLSEEEATYPNTNIPIILLEVGDDTETDQEPPELLAMDLYHGTRLGQDVVLAELEFADASPLYYADIALLNTDDEAAAVWSLPGGQRREANHFQLTIPIPEDVKAGHYTVHYLALVDQAGNRLELQPDLADTVFADSTVSIPSIAIP
jgi:subtilisin family serine protease